MELSRIEWKGIEFSKGKKEKPRGDGVGKQQLKWEDEETMKRY